MHDTDDEELVIPLAELQLRANHILYRLYTQAQALKTEQRTLRALEAGLMLPAAKRNDKHPQNGTATTYSHTTTLPVNDAKLCLVQEWAKTHAPLTEDKICAHTMVHGVDMTKLLRTVRSDGRRGKRMDAERCRQFSTLDPVLAAFFAKTSDQLRQERKRPVQEEGDSVPHTQVVMVGAVELAQTMYKEQELTLLHLQNRLLQAQVKSIGISKPAIDYLD